ncbi:TRAP transporter small permease [Rhodoligotrophos defluvii]|uniref:TRAP transporter small permease n=1 Tax=Rhodoligotrophos defluvii TaxID=2561934 RepID=UPI0010C93EBD|nr:TRAP transporter small permease [Rhodoligotrophos defluvii]
MFQLGRLLGRTIDVTSFLAGLAVLLMMSQITIDVAGKYLLDIPVPATIAMVSNYYMVVVAFLPLALAERRNDHISVELFTEGLPRPAQRHLHAWTCLFSAIVFGFLAFAGWEEASTKHAIGAFIIERAQRIPVWPSYYLLPIGSALMALTLLYRFLIYLFGAKSGLGQAEINTSADTRDEDTKIRP